MNFELAIDASGKATAKLVGPPLSDAILGACLESTLAGPTFSAEAAGVTRFHLQLRDGTRVVRMIELGTETWWMRREPAVRTLRANFPRLRGCYEQLLLRRGLVDGSVTFDLRVRTDGTVSSLNVDSSPSFEKDPLLWCVADVVASLGFEKQESSDARIRYRLGFAADAE